MSEEPRTVGIIGGGVAGLTAAYRLLQKGHRVQLFEASPSLGGLVRTFEIPAGGGSAPEGGGEPIECFYHHLFTTDTAAIRLIDELGLGDRLTWQPSSVGIFYDGRIYPFVTPMDLLRFTPVGLIDRVRLGLMGLYLRWQKDGSRYESIRAKEWVRRFAGQRNLDVVWGPLLRGKFGDLGDELVMTWLWNKIHLRFASRGAGPSQREVLGYLRGSFGAWIEALIERVRELGGELQAGRPVQRIVADGGRVGLELAGERRETLFFDAVVATVANSIFRRIAPPLPESYAEKLEGVVYQDALCLVLTLKRPLSSMYWLNVNDRSIPFLAIVEHTNLIEPERYGGQHVVYISNYLDKQSPLLSMDVDQVCELYLPHLKRINAAFEESWIIDRWLFRGADAQPVFTVGAGSRIPEHRTPVPGLYLANMSQIYPQDRGQNYSILLGENIAETVAADLARTQAAHSAI
ncbi:MAG: NAD(P)/FAD-dependent oxidoreductase [Chloroflexi bacterium]|nr:NAD(P)/FAD-dependent oxidoreductase [Chloroflexota bacterium]